MATFPPRNWFTRGSRAAAAGNEAAQAPSTEPPAPANQHANARTTGLGTGRLLARPPLNWRSIDRRESAVPGRDTATRPQPAGPDALRETLTRPSWSEHLFVPDFAASPEALEATIAAVGQALRHAREQDARLAAAEPEAADLQIALEPDPFTRPGQRFGRALPVAAEPAVTSDALQVASDGLMGFHDRPEDDFRDAAGGAAVQVQNHLRALQLTPACHLDRGVVQAVIASGGDPSRLVIELTRHSREVDTQEGASTAPLLSSQTLAQAQRRALGMEANPSNGSDNDSVRSLSAMASTLAMRTATEIAPQLLQAALSAQDDPERLLERLRERLPDLPQSDAEPETGSTLERGASRTG